MPHPDPPCLTLARAIRDLLIDSGATVSDQNAALDIAQTIINAEYAESTLGPMWREQAAAGKPTWTVTSESEEPSAASAPQPAL